MAPRNQKKRKLDGDASAVSDADAAAGSQSAPEKTESQDEPDLELIQIDPDGDLVLRVGSGVGRVDMKVCSAAMRRASAVWKTMLFGPWKEAKPTEGRWIVHLPEDQPWPLRILLEIAHGNFASVSKRASFWDVYAILIVTDKYDLFPVIRPWTDTWVELVKDPKPTLLSNLTGYDHIVRIHTAWELGCQDVVAAEMRDFIFNTQGVKTENGIAIAYKGEQLSKHHHSGPPDLVGTVFHDTDNYLSRTLGLTGWHVAVDTVTVLRISLIQTILDFYHGEINRRTQNERACLYSSDYYNSDEREKCDTLILGGVWRYLKKAKRHELPERASETLESAQDLMNILSTMFKSLRCLGSYHEKCNPRTRYLEFEAKTKADPRWTDVLRPHHKERMAEQRKKLGLDSDA